MPPGRALSIFMAMIWEIDSVPAYAETIQVTIDKLVFSLAEIKAIAGDTVTWIHKDIIAHTATVRGGSMS
jgi:plastocyanin